MEAGFKSVTRRYNADCIALQPVTSWTYGTYKLGSYRSDHVRTHLHPSDRIAPDIMDGALHGLLKSVVTALTKGK